MQDQKGGMTAEHFADLLAHEKWQTIDQMVDALDDADYWADDFADAALHRMKREHCRRMARSLRRDDGRHVFVHVVETLPTGEKQHVYKQQTLFNVDDYRFAVNFHKQMGIHHIARANELAKDCQRFLGKQLPLPFPSFNGN